MSKRQRELRQDLLAFRTERQPTRTGGGSRHRAAGHYVGGDDAFVLSSFRFGVLEGADVLSALSDPDALVEWDQVKQVVTWEEFEECSCPICIETPVAPRVTKCGHVFCLPCVLQFDDFTKAEKEAARAEGKQTHGMRASCPVCQRHVDIADLKSVSIVPVRKHAVGDLVHFTLIRRPANSVVACPAGDVMPSVPPPSGSDAARHSRYYTVTPAELLESLAQEERGLVERLRDVEGQGAALDWGTAILDSDRQQLQKAIEIVRGQVEAVGAECCAATETQQWERRPAQEQGDTRYAYQASDGQLVFLHPLTCRMLNHDALANFGLAADDAAPVRWDLLPPFLEAKVREMETHVQDERARSRFRSIAPLPLGCSFSLVLADPAELVGDATVRAFAAELTRRDERLRLEERRAERAERDFKEREREKQEEMLREAAYYVPTDPDPAPDRLNLQDDAAYPRLCTAPSEDGPAVGSPPTGAWGGGGAAAAPVHFDPRVRSPGAAPAAGPDLGTEGAPKQRRTESAALIDRVTPGGGGGGGGGGKKKKKGRTISLNTGQVF
eukprot:TRINITY_DN3599_c0_g2_i1.p1 TRINITY_DN3599_c0_g2~~TRINITY_DN3599_c0_g2_i1.p1  ORF type:complete len:556 (+),score=160.94 TRINITY_DN3599_c0_g2_i1:62-1729(+)